MDSNSCPISALAFFSPYLLGEETVTAHPGGGQRTPCRTQFFPSIDMDPRDRTQGPRVCILNVPYSSLAVV